MNELRRMTSRYVPHEDRIRLTGEDDAGQVVTLWLTQRLLSRLIGPLCQWMEESGTGGEVIRGLNIRQQLEQTFVQQRVAQALTPQAPIQPTGDSTAVLVHSVDLRRSPKGGQLRFKNSAGDIVATIMA